MKKIFTLLLSLSALPGVFAQDIQRQPYRNTTQLSISSFYGNNLQVVIDNKTYTVNSNKDNGELYLNSISAGYHKISIRRVPNKMRDGVYNSQAIQVLYNADVYLKENYQTDITVNRFGRIFKDEQALSGYDPSGNTPYPDNNYNREMSAENFNALKTTITNERFNESKLSIAKQAGAVNYFTAAQVKQLMVLFSFDESRLDIAKTLYPRTTDKQNYFMVNDAFSFSGSKEELTKFISRNP